jgi:beta-lactam-binding protein with PASTA domain
MKLYVRNKRNRKIFRSVQKEKIFLWRKKYVRYPILVVGIFAALFVFLWVVDRVLLPAAVHSGRGCVVPEIIDKPLEEAKEILQKKDLSLQILAEEYNPLKPPGIILSQNPVPQTKVKKGRIVKVVVSKGEKMVEVPDLKGVSLRQAEIMLGEEGLEVGEINWTTTDSFPENVVIESSPSFGLSIPTSMGVNLTVSLGSSPDRVTMPDLVGTSLKETKSILKEFGLAIGEIRYETKDYLPPETVLEQFPQEGIEVEKGTKVNLKVSTVEL